MNKVVHFEIPFDDKARASKFYGEIFGWALTDMPQMNYVMAETAESGESGLPNEPGAINGGLFPLERCSLLAQAATARLDTPSRT
jgi:predicted enzyme related to lactoylglutathione lyase